MLLVAECTDRFRAVFSFGPVSDVSGYPPQFLPFDTSNPKEVRLRSPGRWLSGIHSPTFVFEGEDQGNLSSLTAMQQATKNPMVHFLSHSRWRSLQRARADERSTRPEAGGG